MKTMLHIASDILPQGPLAYLAFRVAFQDTLERMVLARQFDEEPEGIGYLAEVPFLRTVPPHVQLDVLADTWRKHHAAEPFTAGLIDESVIYGACETAAVVVEMEPDEVTRYLQGGPRRVRITVDRLLAAELRSLHLSLANEGDFLMISQFEDMRPDEARWMKRKFRMDEGQLQDMFDLLGRWNLSPQFAQNLKHLLSPREITRVQNLLETAVYKR
jgi:hypothetical protein